MASNSGQTSIRSHFAVHLEETCLIIFPYHASQLKPMRLSHASASVGVQPTAALTCSASCGGCNSRKCGDSAGSEPKKKKRVNLLYVEALELSLLKALSVFMTLAPPLKPIGRTKKFAFSIRGNTLRAPVDRCRVNFPTFSSPPSRLCWRPEVFSPPPPPSALAC